MLCFWFVSVSLNNSIFALYLWYRIAFLCYRKIVVTSARIMDMLVAILKKEGRIPFMDLLSEAGKRDRMCSFTPCNRSEEHTSELQSLMRISYAVFCLKK